MKDQTRRRTKRAAAALAALFVAGSLVFGAAQAIGSSPLGNKCVDPDTNCPCKAGCRYGGRTIGCCVLP